MSGDTKDGGSAFPIETTATPYASGMSLRDWFAGQALTNPYTAHDGDADKVAEWAYQVADAMIFVKSNRIGTQVVRDLEAKLAKAVGLLESWINVATHCTIEEGVCCCGDNMDTHAKPMDCGHSPVDHGAYIANGLVEETNATLAELTGGKDDCQ